MLNIRWLIGGDFPQVLAIEAASFARPWCENEFRNFLRQKKAIGLVLEVGGVVVGYILYELCDDRLEIYRIAVHPNHRRKGVGIRLVRKLLGKLSRQRSFVGMDVSEFYTEAHLWLRACGFRAVAVCRENGEQGETTYRFTKKSSSLTAYSA